MTSQSPASLGVADDSEVKHTPGPWQVNHLDQLQVCDADGELRSCAPIARVTGGKNGETRAEARANARLIAAAPSLLKALQFAVRQNSHDMLMTGEELRQCEAAIALASREVAQAEPVAEVIFTQRKKPDVEWVVESVKVGTKLYASPAAPVAETFWLIESVWHPRYWNGSLEVFEDALPGRMWAAMLRLIPKTTDDPNEAVRFTTRALAEGALACMQTSAFINVGKDTFKVTEHMWPAPSPAAGAAQAVAENTKGDK